MGGSHKIERSHSVKTLEWNTKVSEKSVEGYLSKYLQRGKRPETGIEPGSSFWYGDALRADGVQSPADIIRFCFVGRQRKDHVWHWSTTNWDFQVWLNNT